MIPKIIHYCWFGKKPLPPLALKCIASWKKYLPGYEIKQWNEDNYDVNSIPYIAVAYKAKKYAFVSDYARLDILYKFGGLYFDTDVELIRPIDDIIDKGSFMGFEINPTKWNYGYVNPGLGFGVEPKLPIVSSLLTLYKNKQFILYNGKVKDGETIVDYTTEVLMEHGMRQSPGIQLVEGIFLYPSEYFAPIHFISRRLHITQNTRSIHRYMATWKEQKNKSFLDFIKHYLPEGIIVWQNRLRHPRNTKFE